MPLHYPTVSREFAAPEQRWQNIDIFMKRWQVIVLAVAVILVTGIVAGYRAGVRLLQDKIVAALGAGSGLSELKVNWFSIELLGLSIDAPKGWPTARTLEAERVTIVPDLRSLFSDQIRISTIVIENPYLSVVRNPGKIGDGA